MKKIAALLALALAAGALVACGGDDEEGGGTVTTPVEQPDEGGQGASTIQFEADPGGALAYTEDLVTADAGKATIELQNPSSVPHDVAIEDEDGETVAKTDVITDGSDTATANLEAGKYVFYCSVPGHREAGMEGTLNVE